MGTFASALVSVLVYSGLWGGFVASGLVAGMWAHELGHQRFARRLGLPASPIVFVPFVGALQRLRAQPASVLDGALLALAGPLFGLWFAAAWSPRSSAPRAACITRSRLPGSMHC